MDNNNLADQDMINNLCLIISNELGQCTADMYKEHFKDRDKAYIQEVTRELMTEILGEKAAEKRLKNLL